MLTRSQADVTAAATMQYHQMEERNMPDHWSVMRLKDRGWKREAGARMTLRGKEKRLHTQTEMGVISRRTLRELVGEERTCAFTGVTTLLMTRR